MKNKRLQEKFDKAGTIGGWLEGGIVKRAVLVDILFERGQAAEAIAAFFQQKRRDQPTDSVLTIGEGVDLFENKLSEGGNNGRMVSQSAEVFDIFIHQ